MTMAVECRLEFEAAHRNTSRSASEKTSRLHGHSYEVTIGVSGAIDSAIGWVMDFAEIKDRAKLVVDQLDHYTLNAVDGMTDTTLTDVSTWIETRVRAGLPALQQCQVLISGDTGWRPCVSSGDQEWLHFGFAAAHFLPNVPPSHKCRRVHGHSFRVGIRARDIARLTDRVCGLYPSLDHRLLNEVKGLENPTSELLAQWLGEQLRDSRNPLEEIMVAETCTSSCRLTFA